MEHFLMSGMIEDTFYLDIEFEDNDQMNFASVKNNPMILRNNLDELGLKNHMILKIYDGSTYCHLYSIEDVSIKIKERKKEMYRSFLDGYALNISNILNPFHNIYYTLNHIDMPQQYRGFVKINENYYYREEQQPHNFPIGYYGIALNIQKYNDQQFIKESCEEGVWITGFHGTKPFKGKHDHVSGIIQSGFQRSQNIGVETHQDAMANRKCRFTQKEQIGEGNIYFANKVRTNIQLYRSDNGGAEVYTEPIKINDNEYSIIFMCRLNPEKVYSPVEYPHQLLVKQSYDARPYKILIMETINDEIEINFNIYQRLYSKNYENETIETMLKKLQNTKIYDQSNQKVLIRLINDQILCLDNIPNKKETIKHIFQRYQPTLIDKGPLNQIKTYQGIIYGSMQSHEPIIINKNILEIIQTKEKETKQKQTIKYSETINYNFC